MAGLGGYFGPNFSEKDLEELNIGVRGHPNSRAVRPNYFQSSRPMQIPPAEPVSTLNRNEEALYEFERFGGRVNPKQGIGRSDFLIPESPAPKEDEEAIHRYVGIGVGLATLLTENLLSHPFVVLRRQCQVHHSSRKYHLFPFSLVPVIVHLHQRQGITTLWKGIGSVLLVRGMALAVEDLVSKATSWPKEVSWQHDNLSTLSQHILLKCVTYTIITPFYSASLVETVQSDIASEKPGVFDVFREGVYRLVNFGFPQKGRMLPVWALVVPTVMYHLFKYLISSLVKNVSVNILQENRRREFENHGAYPRDLSNSATTQEIAATAQLFSLISADVLFYPLETILHRLHLQGTRTIIDNLDSGFSVTPILTSYEGTVDCYDTTVTQEGSIGLFKGFGALVVQFSVHYAVIKLTKLVLKQVSILMKTSHSQPSVQPKPTEMYHPSPEPLKRTPSGPIYL